MTHSKPGTLTAGVVATVTITESWPHGITIINRSGSGAGVIWYRLDGVDPVTTAADDNFLCIDAIFIPHPAVGQGPTPTIAQEAVEVRLISTAALDYTVEGNPAWKRV